MIFFGPDCSYDPTRPKHSKKPHDRSLVRSVFLATAGAIYLKPDARQSRALCMYRVKQIHYTASGSVRDCTPLAFRYRSRLVSSAVLAGGTHTPVVLCCVLVYTPEPTVRRLRVPDGRRRARVAHAPKAPNDEARVFAKSGHPPRPAQHLQDDPAGRIRVATPHGLPVLVCTRVY